MRITVIYNPSSGDSEVSREVLESILGEAGYQVRYQTTDGEWEKALQEPTDLVVAAGGDGTVRKVATRLVGSGIPFAVLPLGTANNFGKTLRVHGRLGDIVQAWTTQPPVPLDLGFARGPWGESRSSNPSVAVSSGSSSHEGRTRSKATR